MAVPVSRNTSPATPRPGRAGTARAPAPETLRLALCVDVDVSFDWAYWINKNYWYFMLYEMLLCVRARRGVEHVEYVAKAFFFILER